MANASDNNPNSGSRWNRWEPHVHAPGTILNDQFQGSWDSYLDQFEAADPPIVAAGITDYYSTDCYENFCLARDAGRVPECRLIFPNVEMRLAIGTVKGRWVNIHLLVSPQGHDHVGELKRFLARLTFEAYEDTFCCKPDDLIRLGYESDPTAKTDRIALARGTEQFKVSFQQLKDEYKKSKWAQSNILIAVAAGKDGTSGVSDAADATLRQEVEKFAHVIFGSSTNQRDFWLGRGVLPPDEICSRYGSLKPCLHGSDAHSVDKIGVVYEERYCWLKGDVIFDSLHQACIDPEGRAFIGALPPASATPSQVISKLRVVGAPWVQTPVLPLNPGLVAVIGARGSGKTALADMIAAGCNAISEQPNPQSFLVRARDELAGTQAEIEWAYGEPTRCTFGGLDDGYCSQYPRARYLSQQFVEELCSATGMTDQLLREIERVVFEAHTLSSREGAVDFDELLDDRAERHRRARHREEEALSNLSERIGLELEKERICPELKLQSAKAQALIARYMADRSKLVSKGSEARVARLAELAAAADKVRSYVRSFRNQQQALLSLQDEVSDIRRNQAPEMLRRAQEKYKQANLNTEEWSAFLLDYPSDADRVLEKHLKAADASATAWKGKPPVPAQDLEKPYVADGAELLKLPLATLEAEIGRLEQLVSFDRASARKFAAVSKRIAEESAALERLEEKLADCSQAKQRAAALIDERGQSYVRVFDAIIGEQNVLEELYAPLLERLSSAEGTLKKLSFSVARVADVAKWAEMAEEELLDLRRIGPFKGRGALLQRAEQTLKPAWETGSAVEISEAMRLFRVQSQEDLFAHSKVPKAQHADFRAWLKRFAQWLYDTSHISIRYSIDYDGLDIRKLSPGTRGIVLLLLYLALDTADDRPLIIDQPEENLDPKSIFEELVGLFVRAKSKRQVIMVTHNANLVINTDADQIIVAQSGPQPAVGLPPINYLSGGLESEHIRKAVCDILEGGDKAFKERARRLRVHLRR